MTTYLKPICYNCKNFLPDDITKLACKVYGTVPAWVLETGEDVKFEQK